jgi:[acyl-carrier-protein] S-malonyltransferase
MNKIGAIFSGQGSQYTGMGLKLRDHSIGKKVFQEANDILGMDIESLCCNGTDEQLGATEVTQPAIVTCSISAFRIITSDGFDISELTPYDISATAGLSVGEYSALVASGALSFADAIRLVKERGRLMAEASRINPGTMMAIIGLDSDKVNAVCEEASSIGVVQPANYNSPGQIVISGEKVAIQNAGDLAKKAGAKLCVPLDVSGAFHSPLMKPAEAGLREALSNISFSKPEIPFVANITGDYVHDPETIKQNLALQLSNSIQWEASVKRMLDDGITTFIEFGPSKILSGLVRRIYQKAKIFSSEDIL